MTEPAFTLQEQVAEVAREIALRKNVYPKWVASGRMKPAAADLQIAKLEAVLRTLKWLEKNREKVVEEANQPKEKDHEEILPPREA